MWRQIQADVYGRPVSRLEAEEGGAFGAALLAGTGVGGVAGCGLAACAATIRVAEVIEPTSNYGRGVHGVPAGISSVEGDLWLRLGLGLSGMGLAGRVFHAPFVSAVPGLALRAFC